MSVFSIPKNPLKNLFHRNRQEITEQPKKRIGKFHKVVTFSLATIQMIISGYVGHTIGNYTGPPIAYHLDSFNKSLSLTSAQPTTYAVKTEGDFPKVGDELIAKKWPNIEGYEPIASNDIRFYFSNKFIKKNKSNLINYIQQYGDCYKEYKLFSKFLNQKHGTPEIQKRANAIKNVIKLVSKIKNPIFKAEVISAFVNMAFAYDYGKSELISIPDKLIPDEIRLKSWASINDMVINGKGVCIDQVVLKTAMLVSCGENPKNILFLDVLTQKGNHILFGVKTPEGVSTFDNGQFTNKDAKTLSLEKFFKQYLGRNGNMHLFDGTYELTSGTNMNFENIIYTKLPPQEVRYHYEPNDILNSLDANNPEYIKNMITLFKIKKIAQDCYKARGGRYL